MDTPLTIAGDALHSLAQLRDQRKFGAEGFYSGCLDENLRADLDSRLNDLLARLIASLPSKPTKSFVLSEFSLTLDGVRAPDTEDRERLCGYLEQIMELMGVESSDGLLNRWMYGFDPKSAA